MKSSCFIIIIFIRFKMSIVNNRRQWHPTPVLLLGKSHGWRRLLGCNPWGRWESDTTERLHFHFSLSCIGEGNGSPLQCSCLDNPRDGGAWWAAVYGVAQSRTLLKWLSIVNNCFHGFLLPSLTQDSNPGPLHCRQVPYWLNYEGSPLFYYSFSYINIAHKPDCIISRNLCLGNSVVLEELS